MARGLALAIRPVCTHREHYGRAIALLSGKIRAPGDDGDTTELAERRERRNVGVRDKIRNPERYRGVHRGLYGRGFSVLPHSFSSEVNEGVEELQYC